MSSCPGVTLEEWLADEYYIHHGADLGFDLNDPRYKQLNSQFKCLTYPQFKRFVALFEPHRKYVEEQLLDFDEENQSWRAYSSAVFGSYFEEEFQNQVQNFLANPGPKEQTMTYSTDRDTGLAINAHLVEHGVETPFHLDRQPKRERLQDIFTQLMMELGLNLADDSLMDTPRRLAKLYDQEYMYGLDYANFPKATVVENKMKYDEMLIERDVRVRSLCEHHFLPIVGSAFVAYLPEKKILGISKINSVVDFFCRRPQIQERLTMQIYYALSLLLETPNVAVIIQAEHMCVKTRGVEDPCSDTTTSKLGGAFKDPATRAEFIALSKGLV